MKKLRVLLTLSLSFNLLLVAFIGFVIFKKGQLNLFTTQLSDIPTVQEYPDYYLLKKDVFESSDTTNIDKVFVGDSISDYGNFQEYFSEEVVLNRGISNDNAKGVLNRIDEVVNRNPKEVYMMIGINDILHGTDIVVFEENVKNIVQAFDQSSSKVIVQSILPVNNDIFKYELSNDDVAKFNEVLQKIAQDNDTSYLDLHPYFTNENGELKKEYTFDGIHLNGKGYQVWIDVLASR